MRAPVASRSCSSRHGLTGRAGGRAWSEGRVSLAGAGGASGAEAWLARRHSLRQRRVSGAPDSPAPAGVSALSHAPLRAGPEGAGPLEEEGCKSAVRVVDMACLGLKSPRILISSHDAKRNDELTFSVGNSSEIQI